MQNTLPPLLWVRTFEACARHLSFARAGDELALSPAAVGQHIRLLEAHLGFMLFERLPRAVRLTTVGRAYFPMVAKLLDDFSAATLGLFGHQGSEAVTVRCAVSFAVMCLAPALPDFRRAHPGIAIRVFSSVWSDDLADDRIDLEVRYGKARWDGFEATPLGRPVSVPVCPPATYDGRQALTDAAIHALLTRDPIQILGMENLWARLSDQLGVARAPLRQPLAADTSAIALEMVASGLGCAIIDRNLAALAIRRGLVTAIPQVEIEHDQQHWLLCARDRRALRGEAAVVREWMQAQFSPGPVPGGNMPLKQC